MTLYNKVLPNVLIILCCASKNTYFNVFTFDCDFNWSVLFNITFQANIWLYCNS